ncbi:MAG TPA: hypothetical protein EYH16_00855 [Leucothrix mucor]|nr:hypothetical protein [Leucothrix mucor]
MILESTITCPECGFKKREEMPANTCQTFWRCKQCKKQTKAIKGECCVYCSYGDYPCPNAQMVGASCCGRD